MITLHEAYLKAKNERAKKGFTRLNSCRDYGDFWGFMFMPPENNPNDPLKALNGIGDITINKKTGEVGSFHVVMDFDLAERAIPISIEQFAEYNVAI